MRGIILILTSIFLHANLFAVDDSTSIGKSGKMPVVYSENPVTVDGELDEPIWQSVLFRVPLCNIFRMIHLCRNLRRS